MPAVPTPEPATRFSDYVAARGRALWRFAWLLTGDADLAEDLVQTALTKAWPHFDRVSAHGSFEAYVRRAMVHTLTSWRGRRWRGEVPTDLNASGHDTVVPAHDHDRSLDVARALGALSPRQRAVVVLRYFEDLTEADVAATLGCSVGTVKTHHARAIAALRASGLLERHHLEDLEEPS